MLSRLLFWWRSRREVNRLSTANKMANDWLKSSVKAAARLKRLHKDLTWYTTEGKRILEDAEMELRQLYKDFKEEHDSLMQEVIEAERLLKQHEVALEALRSENKILGEVEIPTLTSAHQQLLERFKALTSIEIARQLANTKEER